MDKAPQSAQQLSASTRKRGQNRRKTLAQVVNHQIDSFMKTSVLFNPLQKKKTPAQNQRDNGPALSRAVLRKN